MISFELQTTKSSSQPWRQIRASHNWELPNYRELWNSRNLLFMFMVRDFRLRYRQTWLGLASVVLYPVITSIMQTFVFGLIAGLPSEGMNYMLFVFSANMIWRLFVGSASNSSTSLNSNLGIISKVYFPRIILPISNALATLVDFLLMIPILGVMLWYFNISLSWNILLAPLLIVVTLLSGIGVGMIVASIATRYRDAFQGMPLLIQVLTYASPISYSLEIVPKSILPLYRLNPLLGAVSGYRWAVLGQGELDIIGIIYTTVFSLVVFVIGSILFRRAERNAVDVL